MNRKFHICLIVAVLLTISLRLLAQENYADKIYVKGFFAEYKDNKLPPAIKITVYFISGSDTIEVINPLSVNNIYLPVDSTTKLIIITNYYAFEVSNIQKYIIPNVEYIIGIGVSRTKECLQIIYYDANYNTYVTYPAKRKCNKVNFNTDLSFDETKFTPYK